MKKVIILHNPKAGTRSFAKSSLMNKVIINGYKPLYYRMKKIKKWEKKLDKVDFVISAGGDGTIRGIVKTLMKRTLIDNQPSLAIFPIGTANNISKALRKNKELNPKLNFRNCRKKSIQLLDVGIVNFKKNANFFLESSGFGLLALLIDKADTSHLLDSKSRLNFALKILHELALTAPSYNYKIKIDNDTYIGKSILLEVVNCSYVGPNLYISPTAKLNDGLLDVVIIEESQRKDFAYHIYKLINGEKSTFEPKLLYAEKVEIETTDKQFHVDDEIIDVNQKKVIFEIRKSVLKFFA